MPVKKRTDQPDWQDLRFLLELARTGSLSAAARSLAVTHATVSRRIASLERKLNRQLFDRRGGRFEVTSDGRKALECARRMEEEAASVASLASGEEAGVAGPVRISTTEVVSTFFLVERLPALLRDNPGLQVELLIDNLNLSLARRDADIAIRHGRPAGEHLVTRKLADYAVYFYARRSYLNNLSSGQMRFIGYSGDARILPEAAYMAHLGDPENCQVSLNSLPARVAAVRAGAGVGLIPKFVASQFPDLTRVELSGHPPLERELWIVAHPDVRTVPRFRICFDEIVEIVAADRSIFV